MNFSSDTAAPVHPAILEALAEANSGAAPSYGADRWTAAAKAALAEVFETDLEMWLVPSGTAANALALSLVCPPHGAIVCHEEAHIERDERGAPEFFTGGAKLSLLPGAHAKIDLAALKKRLDASRPGLRARNAGLRAIAVEPHRKRRGLHRRRDRQNAQTSRGRTATSISTAHASPTPSSRPARRPPS